MGTTVVNGVTYVNSTGSVSIKDLQSAFGSNQPSLSGYRSKKWYKSDFTRGTTSSGAISFSNFRGLSGSIPRVDRSAWPANGKFFFTGNIKLPPGFNTIFFTVYGAGGGGGGSNGAVFNWNGSAWIGPFTSYGGTGSSGGSTSIVTAAGTYSATGGAGGNGGSTGANGSPDPGASGDFIAGGTGYGNGGKGGRNVTTAINADTAWATAAAMFNQTCTTTYGVGGAGGAGAENRGSNGIQLPNSASGNPGTGAGITVWVDYGLY